MMTHMLGTWSRRLDSKNGHRCNAHVMPNDADDASALQEINQVLELASRATARVGGSPALAHQILLDVTNLVITTAEQQPQTKPTRL